MNLSEPLLNVEDLHAGYGKKEILRGVSLAIRSGEIVALVGPNGAGKSTVLKAVAGLLRASVGQVLLNGQDVTSLPTYRRARLGLAYVIQGGAVFPSLTAQEHLTLGRLVARWQSSVPSRIPRAHVLSEDLAAREEPAGLFSGGQRQALALATVLTGFPEVLLCDEPSAGLAPAAANDMVQRIAALSRAHELPVLWVEQRLSAILPLADRAILLRDGRIVATTEEPREWLASDLLAKMTFGDEQQ